MKQANGASHADFRAAMLAGLSLPHKAIPCKYLYDERGSRLFEQICALPEYYLTRAEVALLGHYAPAMAAIAGPACRVVELGAGSTRKIRILLSALDVATYVPVDVSRDYLLDQAHALGGDYPQIEILPVCADFTCDFALPPSCGRSVGFFPGSTIGNMQPAEAQAFLARLARLLGADGLLLIGVDLKKDRARLHAAYNDAAGITAAFTRNVLVRANHELAAGFDVDAFAHRATWDEGRGCMAVHLVSRRDQAVHIDGRRFAFAAGEAIHIEDSYKYTIAEFHALAHCAGYVPERVWSDGAFSIHCLRPAGVAA